MIPQDAVTWWTAFGAIAQAIGAVATFAAVAVSLWVVRSERAMKAQGMAGIRVMFAGDGSPGVYMVGVEVLNIGVRPFHLSTVGWRCGWLSRGPKVLRHRHAIQNDAIMESPKPRPIILAPGIQEGFYTTIANMKTANATGSRNELFDRKLPLLGHAPIRAVAHITGRKPVFIKVSKELAEFLRTGEHASTTDDAAQDEPG